MSAHVTIVETFLVFAVIPLAIYGVATLVLLAVCGAVLWLRYRVEPAAASTEP